MPQPVSARLKIGLSACFSHADPARSLFTNKTLQYVEQSIAHWLMSAGAMVVMVPCPTGETARGDTKLSHYAEWLDGVVMHGGADVWPGSYGEVPLKDAWVGDRIRDLYDLALVEAFEQAGKPIFGVCRGLQLINVAFGGTLYQDIEAQHEHPETVRHRDPVTYDQNFHQIEIVEGTRLAKLYPEVKTAKVNSIHHQGVKDLAPGFEIEAWSLPDRVPEAIRRRADRAAATSPPRSGTPNSTSTAAPRRSTTRPSCTTFSGPAPPRRWRRAPCRMPGTAASATARRGCCARHCCGADAPAGLAPLGTVRAAADARVNGAEHRHAAARRRGGAVAAAGRARAGTARRQGAHRDGKNSCKEWLHVKLQAKMKRLAATIGRAPSRPAATHAPAAGLLLLLVSADRWPAASPPSTAGPAAAAPRRPRRAPAWPRPCRACG